MKRLLAGIKILRPLNMILILVSVIIAAWLTGGMTSPLLPYTALVVLCFAGASNILNDILDINIDEVNRPERVLPSGQLRIFDAVILMSVLFALGIMAATYLQPVGRQIALFVVLPLLVLYTPLFKRLPLIGNFVVASILGLVFVFTEAALFGKVDYMWVPFCLATSLSTIRELAKDAEDMAGDAAADLRTFSREFGVMATVWMLRILVVGLCLGALVPLLEGWYGMPYLVLLLTIVEIPMLYAVFLVLDGNSTPEEFTKTARILKGTTIAGMLVILATGF